MNDSNTNHFLAYFQLGISFWTVWTWVSFSQCLVSSPSSLGISLSLQGWLGTPCQLFKLFQVYINPCRFIWALYRCWIQGLHAPLMCVGSPSFQLTATFSRVSILRGHCFNKPVGGNKLIVLTFRTKFLQSLQSRLYIFFETIAKLECERNFFIHKHHRLNHSLLSTSFSILHNRFEFNCVHVWSSVYHAFEIPSEGLDMRLVLYRYRRVMAVKDKGQADTTPFVWMYIIFSYVTHFSFSDWSLGQPSAQLEH